MKNHLIKLDGVTVHNLKNISIEFPTMELIVLTGVSGSGKSSIAFDTLYTEGQRRYVESLSHYLKKQMGGLKKPEAQSIEGVTPTLAIEQKSVSKNPRSTVATLTGIQDFLRIVFAKIGVPHCPISQKPVKPLSIQEILKAIYSLKKDSTWLILAPYAKEKKGAFKEDFKELQKKGFLKALVDDELIELAQGIELDKTVHHTISVLVDRIQVDQKQQTRILESVQAALQFHDQTFFLYDPKTKESHFFSTQGFCPISKNFYPELESQDFSYNHPQGMCEKCQGLGVELEFDLSKLINPELSLKENCIAFMGSYATLRWGNIYENLAQLYGFSCETPWKNLSEEHKKIVLQGNNKKWTKMVFTHPSKKKSWIEFISWKGILSELRERYEQAQSESYKQAFEKLMHQGVCSACQGSRLKPYPSATRLHNRTFFDVCSLPLDQALDYFQSIPLSESEKPIASGLIQEIERRLKFLIQVGLEYLSLSRSAPTLSGGEAQRIRLASQIGSGLIGTTFILDEPSIGLHPVDNIKLIETLKNLRDQGNTLVVVEHDEETILSADRVIDVGPKAGVEGGEILSNGSIADLLKVKKSLTGAFLRGDFVIPIPETRRTFNQWLHLYGASFHNLKHLDVSIPLGCFVAVTGQSGSGKSSLILGTLYPLLSNLHHKTDWPVGALQSHSGLDQVKKVIAIDQTPIGRTPRSNPATYVKIFDDIRELFSQTPEAQAYGFHPGRFSFNVKEGSCPHCLGMGVITIDMDFLEEDVVDCPLCEGKRFDPQTLSVQFKNHSIYDILNLSVTEAKVLFSELPHLYKKLDLLEEVGLGYMKLGQSSTTLSGGEAQRIKLAKELIRPSHGQTVYILDEPTTGLHFADIEKLLKLLNRLVDYQNTVIVIEHNMDLVKTADYVIDLGPKGGDLGGLIVGTGTPEAIAKQATSTGIHLNAALQLNRKKRALKLLSQQPSSTRLDPPQMIEVRQAREHNLKSVDLLIPRNQITVFMGPSGSGKSSLAFDTIYAEGQRRYVESLSPYLRQFIDQMPKPQIDYIDGLSPAIALDQTKSLKNPRSTIGTMTETYDYLRILFATEGQPYCPKTNEPIKPIHLDYVLNVIERDYADQKITILAPYPSHGLADLSHLKKELQKLGFLRIKLNDTYYEIDEAIPFQSKKKNQIKIVIDRLHVKPSQRKRLYESLEKAKELGKNALYIDALDEERYFHLSFVVESTGESYPPITPKSFLFNAVDGMCLNCLGLGFQYGASFFIEEHLFEETPLSILTIFLKDWISSELLHIFIRVFQALDIDLESPLSEMPDWMLERFLKGSTTPTIHLIWIGLEKMIERLSRFAKKEIKEFFIPLLNESTCPSCHGSRLNPLASHVRFLEHTMQEITSLSIDRLMALLEPFTASKSEAITESVIQLRKKLHFMQGIGLGYLSLDRKAPTLSGGELQRIRLSKQIGASLSGCLYVLDEPTIGLHPHQNHLLNQALIELKNLNNTLILVEHDPMTIAIADHVVDFGPGAGKSGGQILFEGSYQDLLRSKNSLTGLYLSGEKKLPSLPKTPSKGQLSIQSACRHNLKSVSFTIPLGQLTCLTGVSGSGKSTILYDILYQNLLQATSKKQPSTTPLYVEKIEGLDLINKVLLMEQGALGQTSRADLSTYTDLLTPLRHFFASLPEAKIRGLEAKNFSFNHVKGMCKECQGLGFKLIDLKFLSPIKVKCAECQGYRLNPLSLKVKYQENHLGQLLNRSVDELIEIIPPISKAVKILNSLKQVGLGYLPLSQEINTLSGGEAQRLKLSKELAKQTSSKTIFLLDEPSTGLHYQDLAVLIEVFHALLKKGCTIVMVEHHLDLISLAHHVIDLGPESGEWGGEILFEGSPETLQKHPTSYTGSYLKMAKCDRVETFQKV